MVFGGCVAPFSTCMGGWWQHWEADKYTDSCYSSNTHLSLVTEEEEEVIYSSQEHRLLHTGRCWLLNRNRGSL